MSPNKIEGMKERISFLTRTMLAYVAGIYLLAGAVGNYLMDFLERDELVWSEFATMPAVSIGIIIVMSVDMFRLRWKINREIDRIGEPSCSKTST